jgi:hypothetical protein
MSDLHNYLQSPPLSAFPHLITLKHTPAAHQAVQDWQELYEEEYVPMMIEKSTVTIPLYHVEDQVYTNFGVMHTLLRVWFIDDHYAMMFKLAMSDYLYD